MPLPGFIAGLPLNGAGAPNLNMVFPAYVLEHLSGGAGGPGHGGPVCRRHVLHRLRAELSVRGDRGGLWRGGLIQKDERRLFLLSKLTTFGWGAFRRRLFSFQVERIAPTILEAINKIGSMANGPLLALFVIALLSSDAASEARRKRQGAALRGFAGGLLANCCLWWFTARGFLVMVESRRFSDRPAGRGRSTASCNGGWGWVERLVCTGCCCSACPA